MKNKSVFTTGEAAGICNLSQQTIIRCFDNGQLKGFRVPGSKFRRIPREELVAFMKENGIPMGGLDSDKIRVLVVDDDPDALAMVETILTAEGYELIKVSNATEVGLKAAQLTPDLILLDFLMPELNGFDVCKALRGNELTRSIPIMAVTCLSKEEDIERIFSCGADEYLAKPFKVEQLQEKVQELIGKGRSTA